MISTTTNFDELIERLHSQGDYRPVGVTILVDEQNRYLLLQSAKKSSIWSFPQGGIHRRESLAENLARELEEETGIVAKRDLSDYLWAVHYAEIDLEQHRKGERGFSKGKGYIYSAARYHGNDNLVLRPEEVLAAEWVDNEGLSDKFKEVRPEKVQHSISALQKVNSRFGI